MAEYFDIYKACRLAHIQYFQGIFIQGRPLFSKTMCRHFKSDSRRDVQVCIALGVLEKMLASFSGESDSCNAKVVISSEDVKFVNYGGLSVSNALYIRTGDKIFFYSVCIISSLLIQVYDTWPEHDVNIESLCENSIVKLRMKWKDKPSSLISHS